MNRLDLQRLQQVRRSVTSGSAKRLRVDAGLRQSEIAEALGVSVSLVSMWESGQRMPRGPKALAYGLILDDLATQAVRDLGVAL